MKRFRVAMIALSMILAFAAGGARATERADYTEAAYQAARASGKLILIDVWAAWCPICRAQQASIEALVADKNHPDLVVLDVDFDSQKEVWRAFGARQQSTLIVFRGGKELGRSVGERDPRSILKLIEDAKG